MKCKAKKIITLLLSVMLLLSTVNMNVFALEYGSEWAGYGDSNSQKYSDVPQSHWAYEAISRASSKNWFGGYPDESFRPDGSITRAEALKVFVVFLGLELDTVTESSFYDVNPNQWYAPYIEAGKDLFPAHTTVQGKTPFNPDMPVTREDTIYALVNALGYQVGAKYVDESVLNMFTDKNSISGDLKAHFAIALENELVSGFPDGTIRAQDSLTRAEFAILLYRGSFVGHSDNYEAKISKVTVSPASPVEIEIGESVTLSARATYTDGTNQVYSALSPYDADSTGAISLNGTTITGLKEGTSTIKYNDSYLKNESLTVVVKKPTSKLNIKIYEYPEQTELSKVTVVGEVVDADVSSVDLKVNSKDVKISSGGSFTVDVSLNVGNNELKFTAVNKYNDTAEKSINILRTDVPSIILDKYKERTEKKTADISGTVEYYDVTKATLDCNGTPVSIGADGRFSTTVDLKVGKNIFVFTVSNQSGAKAEQVAVVRRYVLDEEEYQPITPTPPVVKPTKQVYTWDWMDVIPTQKQYKNVEVVLVIDDSGSLGGDYGYNSSTGNFTGGTDPAHKRLEVARNFVDSSNENSKIGIVKFDTTSEKVTSRLIKCDASGKSQLKQQLTINNGVFDSRGATYMYTGINDGFSLFESTSPDVMKIMVVFSDGMAHDTEKHAQTIQIAIDKGINIYTVGLGAGNSSYFEQYMKPLASSTDGKFYLANDANNLKEIFEEIIIKIDTQKDSDGDGIPDYFEDTIKYEDNSRMPLDKNKADTDGDELSDGEEVTLKYEYNADKSKVKVTAYMSSDPTKVDSDGDGANDKEDNYPLDSNNK